MLGPDREGYAVLVVTLGENGSTVVGVRQFARDPDRPSHAKPALLVEERYWRQGIGQRLLERLTQHAIDRSVRVFEPFVDAQDFRVMRLRNASGLPYEGSLAHGTREMRLQPGGVAQHCAHRLWSPLWYPYASCSHKPVRQPAWRRRMVSDADTDLLPGPPG